MDRHFASGKRLALCVLCGTLGMSATAEPILPHPDMLTPQAFGAVADGRSDDADSLQALFDEALRSGRPVYLPAADYFVGRSLKVYPGMVIRGAGAMASRLHAPSAPDFDLLQLDSVEDVVISDIGLFERDRAPRGAGAGIAINGDSRRVRIENVHGEGFRSPFAVGRDDAGVAEGIVFRGCYATGARTFGFDINNTRQLLIENCQAFHNRLDGIKLRRRTYNVTVIGGESSHNGIGGPNGNGIDAFAGGTSFVVRDLVVRHNNGSGLYFKTGPLNLKDFGTVANINLYNVRVSHNSGSGVDINRSGGDQIKGNEERLPPLLGHVAIFGGELDSNGHSGLYARGRMISVVGTRIRNNARSGIQLNTASDVSISGVFIAGNSTGRPGSFPGISINGKRVLVRGGVIDGLGTDEAATGPVPMQGVAIDLGATADQVLIDGVEFLNWGDTAHPLRCRMADDASLIVHYGDFHQGSAFGSEGSTLVHNGQRYVKTTMARDSGGWRAFKTIAD